MALALISLPIFLLIFLVNWYLDKRGKKHLPEMIALPAGLFFIMCYIAYELKIGFLAVFIIFFFGYIIGGLTEHILTEERGKKIS
jgi:hypothetical protein